MKMSPLVKAASIFLALFFGGTAALIVRLITTGTLPG
jgi:hypothetical protein